MITMSYMIIEFMITLQHKTGYEDRLKFSWVYIGDEKSNINATQNTHSKNCKHVILTCENLGN